MDLKLVFFSLLNYAFAAFLLCGVLCAVQALRGKLTWGQARVMGMTAALFAWTQVVFYLSVADAVLVGLGLLLGWPLWCNLLLTLPIWLIVFVVYRKLSAKVTFRPALFASLVLVPLGAGATLVGGRAVKEGSVHVYRKYGLQWFGRGKPATKPSARPATGAPRAPSPSKPPTGAPRVPSPPKPRQPLIRKINFVIIGANVVKVVAQATAEVQKARAATLDVKKKQMEIELLRESGEWVPERIELSEKQLNDLKLGQEVQVEIEMKNGTRSKVPLVVR